MKMPTISRFYGIDVYMHQIAKEHNPPHIHVVYGDYEASIDIMTLQIIEGSLKNNAYRLAVEFIKKYQKELMEMWNTGKIRKLEPID